MNKKQEGYLLHVLALAIASIDTYVPTSRVDEVANTIIKQFNELGDSEEDEIIKN